MTRRRRIAVALALGCALAALAAEVVLRMAFVEDGMFRGNRPLPPFGATTNPMQRRWVEAWLRAPAAELDAAVRGMGGFDPELGWTIAPSATDGRYVSNRIGARGPREYAPAPTDELLRILTFGDSFTFCDHVGDAETWQARIEALARGCEVLNFGCGGYGTDQALLRFRRARDRDGVRGDAVALGVMLENIGRNVNRYRPHYYPRTGVAYAKPRFVLTSDGSLELVPLPFGSFREYLTAVDDGSVVGALAAHEFWGSGAAPFGNGLATVRLAAGFFAYRARGHERWWRRPEDEPFRVTVALLESFRDEAAAWGALAAPVLLFPAETDLESLLATGERYWATLTGELEARGVPHLDLSEPLADACRREGRSAGSVYVEGHLDAWANGVVAEAVFAWFERRLEGRLVRR